jgi:hypothetical protein
MSELGRRKEHQLPAPETPAEPWILSYIRRDLLSKRLVIFCHCDLVSTRTAPSPKRLLPWSNALYKLPGTRAASSWPWPDGRAPHRRLRWCLTGGISTQAEGGQLRPVAPRQYFAPFVVDEVAAYFQISFTEVEPLEAGKIRLNHSAEPNLTDCTAGWMWTHLLIRILSRDSC